MDWFERLFGFPEGSYAQTQAAFSITDGRLHARGAKRDFSVGMLTLPSLAELRAEASGLRGTGRPRLSIAEGDVRAMHVAPENRDALFQVASQFNMLEMIGPDVSPECGVTRYQHDRTQGPACAMAAAAALVYRNYLVPVANGIGQAQDRQIDGASDLRVVLARRLRVGVEALWAMRNGYALATREGLAALTRDLAGADAGDLDDLRGLLRVSLHRGVEVTDGAAPGPLVSQVFCSAMPVSYSGLPLSTWAPLARLVLEAAYEATMLAALLNVARGAAPRVLLTRLGGGAFGNEDAWIDEALLRALRVVGNHDLDVVVVSYGRPSATLADLVRRSGYDAGRDTDS